MSNLGKTGEDLAAKHYGSLGYEIIDRNYIQRFGRQMGEIDLVAAKDSEIVFVEVKTRTSSRFGSALEAVTLAKQRKLVNVVKLYINLHPQYQNFTPRIDVATVDVDNKLKPVTILMNAIEDLS